MRDTVVAADAEAVRHLVAATGVFRPDEVAVAVELVEERLAKGVAASGYHFLFAERSGGPPATPRDPGPLAGYACFGPIPCTLTSWDLYWIAVDPALHGQGIGRVLMDRAEAAMKAGGGLTVYIETSSRPDYDPTRHFYLACGYRIEHVFADFYAPGDGKVVYVKRL